MNSKNPYAAPSTAKQAVVSRQDDDGQDGSLGAVAKRTFIVWEKLRVVYVAILVVFTVLVGFLFGVLADPEFWVSSIFGGIFSNLCFFAGPIVDTYISWLGFETKTLRWFIFCAGTLLTALLAFTVVTIL